MVFVTSTSPFSNLFNRTKILLVHDTGLNVLDRNTSIELPLSNSSLRRYIKKIGNEIESLCSLNLSPIVIFLLLFSCRDHCTKLIEPKNGLEKSFSLNLFLDPACGLFWNVVVYWKIDVFFLNIWIFVESVDLGTYFPSTCDSKLRKLKERFKSWIKDWWYWPI